MPTAHGIRLVQAGLHVQFGKAGVAVVEVGVGQALALAATAVGITGSRSASAPRLRALNLIPAYAPRHEMQLGIELNLSENSEK